MATAMAGAKEHVEEIRRRKFSIGGEPNPLTEDLHQAVKNLSAELYAKDVHFLMELIQNAEDNEYREGVDPSLEFVITSKDITATGATATLLLFNNERGFSPKNIDSLCSIGRSTKKGLRKRGYIGEKGIGFKSVFLITAQPYIFSNGYQIRFSEKPCPECNLGYIVPEWVEQNPTISVIESIYGTGTPLPTTTVVLPLKLDKVKSVKEQLSSLHPEILLFLSKIKRLSVREDNDDPRLDTVSAISISSEINFRTRKNIDAESYLLYLSADESGEKVDRECGYHMWRQRFPVKQESRVDVRMDVEEWVITLAFPNGKRLNRGGGLPGIYAFLPTETVTNFPFIIQADFLLASSRENILWDNKWNQGILDCVPIAFLEAFTSLVKCTEGAPVSSLPRMFGFLPVNESSHPELNNIRKLIKEKLMKETIVPCESSMEQKIFRKPCEVGRLKPDFWCILNMAKNGGVSLSNISSQGIYVISYSFDKSEYNVILDFLEVKSVDDDWYAKCIQSTNLVMGVVEDVYVRLLQFIAESWRSAFQKTNMNNIPLFKYVGLDGNVSLCSICEVSQASSKKILLSTKSRYISWLVNWNREFNSANKCFFLKMTQETTEQACLLVWLRDEVRVKFVDVFNYASELGKALNGNRRLVVAYAHFLYHSFGKSFLSEQQVKALCSSMPLVDNYGHVSKQWRGVLVPANGSRWVELIGSNPWRQESCIELGEDYLCSASYAGIVTPDRVLIKFIKAYVAASDVPDLPPANAAIPTMSAPLTKRNVFLLLTWIRNLRRIGTPLPERFLSSIKNGSWLKISLSDSPGHRPPSQSFMLDSSQGLLLQNGSVLVDIPLIDQKFYGDEINEYKEELRTIGVMFENKEAYDYIGKHLMSRAASSSITSRNVLSILRFIKFLRDNILSPEYFIKGIKEGRWLRTSQGDMKPGQSVLFSLEWNAASQISTIPFIDEGYYGKDVLSFKKELELLGVVVDFGQNYQLIFDNLKPSSQLTCLTGEAVLLILSCLRNLNSPDKLIQVLKDRKCLKTNLGHRCPPECFLFNPESEWCCLLQVFSSFPLIDEKFYGSRILSFKNELKQIGVIVDFEEAAKKFSYSFKQLASLSSFKRENVLSFLKCYRMLKKMEVKFPSDMKKCIREAKWLRTKFGDQRSPSECILFSADWISISKISLLPFIDDSEIGLGKDIHEYKQELQCLGIVTDPKDGAKFVTTGLYLPPCPNEIAPESVYSLLKCIRVLHANREKLPVEFEKKIAQKWLKTRFGYRLPEKCLLFDTDWKPALQLDDGPFIDVEFYGSDINSYKIELNVLGVTVDIEKGCQLLVDNLVFHSDFSAINRIYSCLFDFKWENDNKDCKRIWIPSGNGNGEWVSANECVLYDKSNLFGLELHVLEKYYKDKLLAFFGKIFLVKVHPSVDDFCKLWKEWEDSGHNLSHTECCAFWEFVVNNWNTKTAETFAEKLLKLPVHLPSCGNGIPLFDKHGVFIADDLYLKDLFVSSTSHPLFVWYPQPSMKSLPRTKLLEIFSKIGVRTLSESVLKDVSIALGIEQYPVNPREVFLKRGLFRLILGFLADPALNIEAERRHKTVSRLLKITVFETLDPIIVRYSLSISSGNVVIVNASQMIRWDRMDSKFLMKKLDRSGGHKFFMEYASHFSEVVAEGVLWENEDLVEQLGDLITLGFLVEFDEAAIDFLMRKKNLQIFLEDQDYLSTNFPSD